MPRKQHVVDMFFLSILFYLWVKCSIATTSNTANETTTGWTLVMKFARGQNIEGARSLLDFWTGTYAVNEGNEEAMSIATGTETYKSSIVDDWASYNLSAVRVSFVIGGTEKAYVVFDARGSNKKNWFNKSRILYSSWKDLNSQSITNYDSIDGVGLITRRFYMNHGDAGCNGDDGWFVVVDTPSNGYCDWEKKTPKPYFLYSDEDIYEESHTGTCRTFRRLFELAIEEGQAMADVFAIWVSMDMCKLNRCVTGRSCKNTCVRHGNLLGDSCEQTMNISQPLHCHNGAICTHQCICTGNYYGTHCENLNGGFSNWSPYGNCSRECGNGTKTRTRTCNNPIPAGNGSVCTGNTSETVPCNSHPCPTACPNPSEAVSCPCQQNIVNMTSDKLKEVIDAIKSELKVDKTKTSLAMRRKTSATDLRTSAKMLGGVGAVMLAIPFVLIVLSDLSNVYRYINTNTAKKRTVSPV